MLSRQLVVSVDGGQHVLQERTFEYPGSTSSAVPPPGAVPPNYSKPTLASVTFRDAKGGTRTATQTSEYDQAGRLIRHTASDGTLTHRVYDPVPPTGSGVRGLAHRGDRDRAGRDRVKTMLTVPDANHRTISSMESFTGTTAGGLSFVSRTHRVTNPDRLRDRGTCRKDRQ